MGRNKDYNNEQGGQNSNAAQDIENSMPTEYTGTVFDDVFKTLITRIPEYIIPVINEVFGTNYRLDSEVIQLKEELHTAGGKIIADSILLVDGKRYHVELQSVPDCMMAARMVEYDFAIALGSAVKNRGEYAIGFPESCVIYIRNNKNTPDELAVSIRSGNDVLTRKVPIIKIQNYTISELFEKNLLIFLPYYIVRYENILKKESKSGNGISAETIKKLEDDYKLIFSMLDSQLGEDGLMVKNEIIESIEAISSHILSGINIDPITKKEVKKAMGGQVIEMIFDRAKREGIEIGEERGMQQGERQTLFNLYNEGHITSQIAAEKLGLTQEQFLEECKGIGC